MVMAIVATIFILFLFVNTERPKDLLEEYENEDSGIIDVGFNDFPGRSRKENIKLVLLWTPLYKIKTWWTPGLDAFRLCPEKRCSATTDRSLLDKSSAVIFHIIDLKKPGILDMPKHHPQSQIWVFRSQESPYRVYLGSENYTDLSPVDGMFNVTMTYKRESDISDVYGWYQKKKVKYEDLPTDHLNTRPKFALWYSSNCNRSHFAKDRFNLVKRLQQEIPIDIFGKCGKPDPCKDLIKDITKWWECQKAIRRKYKFYLAFENARCSDYITEKLWWALHQGIVPIVMGPSRSNYDELVPPDSFIHVDDFVSRASLVKYLKYLSNNVTAYSKYYDWRKKYEVMIGTPDPPWCKLCEYIHNKDIRTKTYKISEWFNRGLDCLDKYSSHGLR